MKVEFKEEKEKKRGEPQFGEVTIRAKDDLTDGSLHFFDGIISRAQAWRVNASMIVLCDCKRMMTRYSICTRPSPLMNSEGFERIPLGWF